MAGARPEPLFDVRDGGLLTTVQDAGRPDWMHLGVPESGAADPWSRAVANLLVGNDPGRATLEMTLVGPTLVARAPVTIGLAGVDLGARLGDGRRLAPGRSHRLTTGDVVAFPGHAATASATPATGARGYLAVPGGIEAPLVLGSRSTCLAGGFGGLDGRALRRGDVIAASRTGSIGLPRELVWPVPNDGAENASETRSAILRAIAGPAAGLDVIVATQWRVAAAADRVGIRLDGHPLATGIGGETTTHGVPWGAIQVPPDGRPIVLGADHQATGGYRVVGVVISADRPVLGQLGPGARVRIVEVDRATALAALRTRRDDLAAGAAALLDAAGWGALIDAAGS